MSTDTRAIEREPQQIAVTEFKGRRMATFDPESLYGTATVSKEGVRVRLDDAVHLEFWLECFIPFESEADNEMV